MILDAIKDWVQKAIIKAAVIKLLSMLNPVGAIIQAIMAIYNTVMFFIERINQILAFVEAIINSVHKIATGDIDSAANWIEQALARTIPIIIGFLARLLGLSGISDKIKEIIKKIQDTVDKAIDKLIGKIVAGIGKLFGKGKDETSKEAIPADPQQRLNAGLDELDKRIDLAAKKNGLSVDQRKSIVDSVKAKYGFKVLEVRVAEDELTFHGEINPGGDKKKKGRVAGNLSSIKTAKATGRPLVIGADVWLTPEEAEEVDKAQSFLNELYKKGATYGDQSTAFMAMMEQVKAGEHKEPEAIVGTTLHHKKADEARAQLEKRREAENLPVEAKRVLDNEIRKLTQALEWSKAYKAGKNPSPPSWARGLESDLYKFAKK